MLVKIIKVNKGYTLIEVLLTLAILGIVIAMVSNFLGFSTNVFSKSEVKSEIQNQVNAAAYTISNTLRNVKGISAEETDEIGFSIFDIRSKFPQLEEVDYDIIEKNGTYSLHYTISMKGYTVQSKIILNNIKSTNTGTSDDYLWIVITEEE